MTYSAVISDGSSSMKLSSLCNNEIYSIRQNMIIWDVMNGIIRSCCTIHRQITNYNVYNIFIVIVLWFVKQQKKSKTKYCDTIITITMVRSSVRSYRAIVRLNKSISRVFNVVNNSFWERMFLALNSEKDLGSDQESAK